MYEDHTIEEKYLRNFSDKEKAVFYRQHKKWEKDMAKYDSRLHELVFSDSSAIFANYEPKPNTFLEIKYVLNRIKANDPRDTAFELGPMDKVPNADRLALDIAKAFRGNIVCKKVILNGIGLTDNGAVPILRTLRHNQLDLLDIENNKLENNSFQTIDEILSNPNNHWNKVVLGQIQTTQEQKKALERHQNLSFVSVPPRQKIAHILRELFQRQ